MADKACILTTRDFSILNLMLQRAGGRDAALAALLCRKLEAAEIVPPGAVPADVATLDSRVAFSVDGGKTETRILCTERAVSAVGLFLPVTRPRGLALLGLAEGACFGLVDREGREEIISLEKVCYQPETARRRQEDDLERPSSAGTRPVLRLIDGALARPRPLTRPGPDGFDDPGPSAA